MALILGIPVINRPDLLRLCLASIDLDCQVVVIDNSGTGTLGDLAAEIRPDALIVEPAANLGYTASVNHIIRSFPHHDRWLIANADTEFAPGDLARLAREPGWVGITDWRVFTIDAETIDRAGFWDENFQNYCSDADYERRCALAGADWRVIPGNTSHVGSVCWIGDQRGQANNARTYPIERAYYRAKWGGEPRGGEVFTTPFASGASVAAWQLDRQRLADLRWPG